jgi:RNA polymerase sigma-70 factor (ECF subfamily)
MAQHILERRSTERTAHVKRVNGVRARSPTEPRTGWDSFEAFYQAEHGRLYGTLCLVTADAWEAEELVQEAFVRMWERWERIRDHPDPTGYLYRTAFNLARSGYRRAVVAGRRALAPAPGEDPFASLEERDLLARALRVLPRRQRMAVVLTDLLELTSKDAARFLRVRPVTVRVLASQGRQALKEALTDE